MMKGPLMYNRQLQTKMEGHPDCRACAQNRAMLEQQIVQNAVLRLMLLDMRDMLRSEGRVYDPAQYPTTAAAVVRHGEPTCTHNQPLYWPCIRCGQCGGEEEHDVI